MHIDVRTHLGTYFCTKRSVFGLCARFLYRSLTKLLERPVLYGTGGVQCGGKQNLQLLVGSGTGIEKWYLGFFEFYSLIYVLYGSLQPVFLFVRGLFIPSIDKVCFCLCNVDTFVMQIVKLGSARAVHANVGVHKVCHPIFLWRT